MRAYTAHIISKFFPATFPYWIRRFPHREGCLSVSELDEPQWAVISPRGVEASGLSYEAALTLRHILEENKVHGLRIVSNAAALRAQQVFPEEITEIDI
jgi:hypothetical protein